MGGVGVGGENQETKTRKVHKTSPILISKKNPLSNAANPLSSSYLHSPLNLFSIPHLFRFSSEKPLRQIPPEPHSSLISHLHISILGHTLIQTKLTDEKKNTRNVHFAFDLIYSFFLSILFFQKSQQIRILCTFFT